MCIEQKCNSGNDGEVGFRLDREGSASFSRRLVNGGTMTPHERVYSAVIVSCQYSGCSLNYAASSGAPSVLKDVNGFGCYLGSNIFLGICLTLAKSSTSCDGDVSKVLIFLSWCCN